MIVYGFYGTGKSTLCKEYPEKYLDLDFEYFRFQEAYFFDVESAEKAYTERALFLESDYEVVFINRLPEGLAIDAGFIQCNYETCIKTLTERKQGNLIPERQEYDDIVRKLESMGKLQYLRQNEHLSDIWNQNIIRRLETMKDSKPLSLEEELERRLEESKRLAEKIESLKAQLAAQKAAEEEIMKEKCVKICLDALIVGTDNLRARHGEVAPYSRAYYVASGKGSPIEREFCEPVTAKTFEELPAALYYYLKNEKQWKMEDFASLSRRTNKLWKALPETYTPEYYSSRNPSEYLHRNYIANGYETNGFDDIVKGKCSGTYSSFTTGSQNNLSAKLIALKGYCVDYYLKQHPEEKPLFKEVFKRHGIDCRLVDLNKWAMRNPTRCMSDNPYYKQFAGSEKPNSRHRKQVEHEEL